MIGVPTRKTPMAGSAPTKIAQGFARDCFAAPVNLLTAAQCQHAMSGLRGRGSVHLRSRDATGADRLSQNWRLGSDEQLALRPRLARLAALGVDTPVARPSSISTFETSAPVTMSRPSALGTIRGPTACTRSTPPACARIYRRRTPTGQWPSCCFA